MFIRHCFQPMFKVGEHRHTETQSSLKINHIVVPGSVGGGSGVGRFGSSSSEGRLEQGDTL